MRYKLTLSYDGTNFAGYQVQPGLRTVQGELDRAATYINRKQPTKTTGSGRTDAHVHAYGQVAHVDLDVSPTSEKLKRAFNSNLPEDIHVISVEPVADDFHARFSAIAKEYLYKLNPGEYIPTDRSTIYQYGRPLDIDLMNRACQTLLGEHDFRSFISSEDKRENTVRTISEAEVQRSGELILFRFKATGFLKYQVRNMVGTLIEIGCGKKTVEEMGEILASKNRKRAGKTAPACGLYLLKVHYKEEKK